MSLAYDDLQDLIQNQRALAELVQKVKDQYDVVVDDINFAKELETRIDALNTSMESVLNDFDERIAESDTKMEEALELVKANAQELKDSTEAWVNTLKATDGSGNSIGTIQQLVSAIETMTTLVYQGVYDTTTGKYCGGIEELYDRVKTLETKVPTVLIMKEGMEVSEEDRIEDVLYGKITNEVRDIEAGQAIKISPYLQGIVQ